MATVPGTPDNVIGIHPAFQPTQADLLQAAAIMHQQGKFQMAGDVVPFSRPPPKPGEAYESVQKGATRRTLSRVLEMESNVTPIKPEDK